MASYPELRLCRRLLRVAGYGSLWHSGRGWIALPSPVAGLRFQRAGSPSEVPASSISGMMRFLEARSQSQDPYWSSLSSNEGEKAERLSDRGRIEFLERAELKPPPVLRMIDCKASRDEGRVVLMNWKDCVQALGYSAISHTYGQDVYHAFDCTCASICRAAQKPRCSYDTCPHDPAAQNAANTTQTRVVKDILNMCVTLCGAGVRYAWHDGVCIAQHDEDEVRETIQHTGWVYSNGRETIIFLHYVEAPELEVLSLCLM